MTTTVTLKFSCIISVSELVDHMIMREKYLSFIAYIAEVSITVHSGLVHKLKDAFTIDV